MKSDCVPREERTVKGEEEGEGKGGKKIKFHLKSKHGLDCRLALTSSSSSQRMLADFQFIKTTIQCRSSLCIHNSRMDHLLKQSCSLRYKSKKCILGEVVYDCYVKHYTAVFHTRNPDHYEVKRESHTVSLKAVSTSYVQAFNDTA